MSFRTSRESEFSSTARHLESESDSSVLFDTIVIPSGDNDSSNNYVGKSLESTCRENPSFRGTWQKQTLVFQYNLYATTAATTTSNSDEELALVAKVEELLHYGLVNEFLGCTYSNWAQDIAITRIDSAPTDVWVQDSACDTTTTATALDPFQGVEGTNRCLVVNAQLSMDAFFKDPLRMRNRRHLLKQQEDSRSLQDTQASPEFLDFIRPFLQDFLSTQLTEEELEEDSTTATTTKLSIVKGSFQGFLNAVDSREAPPASETSNGVAGLVDKINPPSNLTQESFVLGGMVVAAAAMVLLAVLYVGGRRRREQQKVYQAYLDELSMQDDDDDDLDYDYNDGGDDNYYSGEYEQDLSDIPEEGEQRQQQTKQRTVNTKPRRPRESDLVLATSSKTGPEKAKVEVVIQYDV